MPKFTKIIKILKKILDKSKFLDKNKNCYRLGNKMNYSKQREIILDTLRNNVVHPTAEYIYEILKEEDTKISLATLYRNLNQLADKGIIKKIDGLESSSHYDHNTHAHYHFICDKCKKVFDVSEDIAPHIVEKIEGETGFVVTSHDIAIHGLCKDCKD